MPWQLIYTSAPRTLVAGQSGYGTVARSRDLREALAQRLEQFSYYAHGSATRAGAPEPLPVVFAYRILDFRGSRYHVLTRVQDAGLDFTNRTNHLAQHLVFEPADLGALAPPAIILAQWNGWRGAWPEEPKLLDEDTWGNLRSLPRSVPLPATTWLQVTGDAGKAAALLSRDYAAGCTLVCPAQHAPHVLGLFAESLQLLDPAGRQPVRLWEYPFTTYLQAEDNPADFRWRACFEGSPAWQAAQRGNESILLPLHEVAAPENGLAVLARQGPPKPNPPARGPTPAISGPPSPPTQGWLETPPAAPRALRGYDPAIFAPSTKRAPGQSRREITLDLTAPRVWVPALALLLLLVLGLPHLFKSSKPGDAGTAQATSPPATTRAQPSALTPETEPSGLAPETSAEKAAPPKNGPREPTKEALRQLAVQTDPAPTWLVPLENEAPVLLPPIKELEEMLKQLFFADPPQPLARVDCRLASGRFDLSADAGASTELREQPDPKGLSARLATGCGFDLDCAGWLADKGGGRAVAILGHNLREAGLITARFQSSAQPPAFSPFRVVALGGSRFEPLRLSKTLLSSEGATFAAALHPDLLKWLNSMHLADTRATWQLRPSAKDSATTDLFDALAPAFRPGPDRALDFEAIRQKIAKPLALDHEKLTRLAKAVDEFQATVQNDQPLGQILAHCTNDLSSLAIYAKARNHKLDRQTYLAYLRELIGGLDPRLVVRVPPPDATEDDARLALVSLRGFLESSPALANRLRHLPAGYFEGRWDVLGNVPEMVRKASDLDSTRKSIARYEGFLRLIPQDLESTPRVSLVLVTASGKRFEVVRFEEASPPTVKGAP